MTIFHKSTKKMVITTGVFFACCICVASAVRIPYVFGRYSLFISVVLILVPMGIYKGCKWGYAFARWIFGILGFILVFGSINPFTYSDFQYSHQSYPLYVLGSLFFAGQVMFLFYCLGEHAKMKGLKILITGHMLVKAICGAAVFILVIIVCRYFLYGESPW